MNHEEEAMSFDASRFSFHPWNNYLGVVMQQGRVQLDADWNEWVAELSRRLQAGSLDTMGRAVVPRTTPEGFHILAAGGALTIGVGRMYVDGLLAENHGTEPAGWDERLAEETGSGPVPFLLQPYLPFNEEDATSAAKVFNAPNLNNGTYLVYLDVWQREVTHIQAPELVEKAVGVDTTGRIQTIWQVKVLHTGGNASCHTPDADLPGWQDLTSPSGARLSTSTGDTDDQPNPCLAPPAAEYTGLENQLYRVEIHRGGNQNISDAKKSATFKWSRDNGTVAARVLEIHDGKRLVVDSLGRDDVLGFHAGDWIEILDDWHEFHGLLGRLHRIHRGNGVDSATRSIILDTALPADLFPVDGKRKTDPGRNTRIRRWDQAGVVRRADGSVYHDLNDSSISEGIPIPPAGIRLFLENGILVDFSQQDGGDFHVGDNWVFAARATDGTIEELLEAPPRAIHHHFARLAIVTLPNDETNCREFWPPEMASGESCDCTVCIDPDGHNSGIATIQDAIDVVRARGGGTVCLDVGTYLLQAPLNVQGVRSLRLRGQGWKTVLQPGKAGRVLNIRRGIGVSIECLSINGIADQRGTTAMIGVRDCVSLRLSELTAAATAAGSATSAAVDVSGLMLACIIRDCVFAAEQGIVSTLGKKEYLLTADLRLANNIFLCSQVGVSLTGTCVHYGQARLNDNLYINCSRVGVDVDGASLPQSSFTVSDNVLHVSGTGIICGIDSVRIENNVIQAIEGKAQNDGIVLHRDFGFLGSLPIDSVRVSGNTLENLRGHGISVQHKLLDARIMANSVIGTGGSAFVMERGTSADYLSLRENRFDAVGAGYNSKEQPFFGLLLMAVKRADICDNLFSNVARQAETTPLIGTVAAVASRELRIAGNRLFDLGPPEFMGRTTGILLAPGFSNAAVCDNTITRDVDPERIKASEWQALLVSGVPGGFEDSNLPDVFQYLSGIACLPLETGVMAYLSSEQFLLVKGLPGISVRANCLRATSTRLPSVQIYRTQSCLFDQNDIELADAESSGLPAGEILSEQVGFTSNRIVAGKEISFVLRANKDQFTVMGNLRSGPIVVNGTPDLSLGAPWNALNVHI